jgi:hypothetical protein
MSSMLTGQATDAGLVQQGWAQDGPGLRPSQAARCPCEGLRSCCVPICLAWLHAEVPLRDVYDSVVMPRAVLISGGGQIQEGHGCCRLDLCCCNLQQQKLMPMAQACWVAAWPYI